MRQRTAAVAVFGSAAAFGALVALCTRDAPPAPGEAEAAGEAPDAAPGPPREVRFSSGPNELRAFLYAPARARNVPLIVYNHGSEQDPDLAFLGELGEFYASHGFAVLFPWRQGCAGSGGKFWRDRVPLVGDALDPRVRERQTIQALEQDLADVLAAVDYGKTLPMVDATEISVAGTSFGGLLALMAAARSSAIHRAIVCSGAAWTYDGSTPEGQTRLDALARTAKAPVFFLQAKNDFNSGSSEALGRVMDQAGLPHRVTIYPAHGKTQMMGHAHFCNHGMPVWGDDALAFLRDGR